MGWMRTILLGDIGNRLDVQDAERDIQKLNTTQNAVRKSSSKNELEIIRLKDEVARHKLSIEALTRFLVTQGIIKEQQLDEFIKEVDAQDGVIDGKMELDEKKIRLKVTKKN